MRQRYSKRVAPRVWRKPNARRKAAPTRKYTRKTKTTVKSAGSYGKTVSSSTLKRSYKLGGKIHHFASDALKMVPQQVKVYDFQGSVITGQGSQGFYNIVDAMPDSRLQVHVADSTAYEKLVWIEGVSVNTTLFNMTTDLIARVTVYDWQTKESCPAGLTLEATITNGFAAKYNATNPQNVPYMDPTESPEFNRFFKIVKKTELVLAPNENHVHKHSHVINKLYNNLLETNITDPAYMRGFSSGVFIRVLGGCVGGTSTGQGAHTITYGAVRVGHVTQVKEYVKFPQGSSANQVVASVGTLALSDITTPQVPLSYNDTLVVPNTTM